MMMMTKTAMREATGKGLEVMTGERREGGTTTNRGGLTTTPRGGSQTGLDVFIVPRPAREVPEEG